MENKNGQGIFYGVIGVATLVVAIIGATFAYFSAQATATGDNIEGGTADVAGELTLSVTKVNFGGSATYKDLVPADIDASSSANLTKALTAKCEDGSYTGCHVYEISAASTTNITGATISLNLSKVDGDATDWKYLVYEGSQSSVTTVTTNPTAFPASNASIYTGALSSTATKRYLMVYIANKNASQNTGTGATNQTGQYTGTVTLNAAGSGQVKATLNA